MKDCTGIEITEEWLYHMGVPEAEIHDMAVNSANCVPCMMPYVTSYFMPRAAGDRPNVVPDGCVNAAFIGNFAETPRDTVFTTEYSVRTAMEAVYTLLDIDRGVPEVFGSAYDVRVLLDSTAKMMDGNKLTDMELPDTVKLAAMTGVKKISNTRIMQLLKEYKLI
jgi:oleate hydratase